ncbi:hypothetical protein MASR2M18_08600 [Ignavibacteria bacterium]|nr:hypothetical protein [Bacteroidota bacterium]MCZ2133694.1 hypothetical protein [Bacteroidota bacterium]
MTKSALYLLLFSICFSGGYIASANRCSEQTLLSGDAPIVSYGIDTTRHWWAITQPFSSGFRLIVDGKESDVFQKILYPVFSPNGDGWAAFALGNTGQWFLLQKDTILALNCSAVGDIYFGQSGAFAYTYEQGANELFVFNGTERRTIGRTSEIIIDCDGYKFAYSARRGDGEVIVGNDGESELFDRVRPIGIWYGGKTMFIAEYGGQSRLYKGTEPISRTFDNIADAVMNNECTAVAIAGYTKSGAVVQLYSDEYYEPLESRMYEAVSSLVIHPNKPMYACIAQYNSALTVVFNGTEYDAGRECGKPFFTHNGAELIFAGADQQYFFTVNGKRYIQPAAIDINREYAVKPGGGTFAYGSSNGLVERDMQKNMAYSGLMVDEATSPRYNWRNGHYEALGRINQRLYLLACE